MYTKARIAGHPIHPMLVAFPVALYVATVVALIVHAATSDPFWYRAAMFANIGGVVMAIVATVPGLVDLINLPVRSRARLTGVKHAAFNVLALVLFSISAALLYRNAGGSLDPATGVYELSVAAPLVLSILGVLSTVTAGWLGYTMVQTHHVGVRPSRRGYVGQPVDQIDDLDELAAQRGTHQIPVRRGIRPHTLPH